MGMVSPYSDTNMAHVFEDIFVFDTIRVYIPSKNLHAQGKIALVSVWIGMVLTSVELVLPIFRTIWGIYNEEFTFFETSRL